MKRPARYSRRRIVYTGQLDRNAYLEWSDSPEGKSVLEPIAAAERFALFGRMRAARNRVWREMMTAVRSSTVAETMQREIDGYLQRIVSVVYADDLPRLGVDLHRLVVVPRLFANAALDRRLDAALESEPAFSTRNGRKWLRDWFVLTVVDAVEAAVVDARPSPKQPLQAGDDWIVIGLNERFEWRVPFKGPAWPGHYFAFEVTKSPITRAVRDGAANGIARLEGALPSLTRSRRDDILKKASSSYTQRPALFDHSSCTV